MWLDGLGMRIDPSDHIDRWEHYAFKRHAAGLNVDGSSAPHPCRRMRLFKPLDERF